jgi:hypothetical protein
MKDGRNELSGYSDFKVRDDDVTRGLSYKERGILSLNSRDQK